MKIFISHSRKDNPFVHKIEDIVKQYAPYWVDYRELKDWDEFNKIIHDNIKDSTVFLLIWSKGASESPYVKKEIDLVNSDQYRDNIQKVAFNIDNTSLPKPYESRLYRLVNEKNFENEVDDVIFKYTNDFNIYFKIFKQIVQKQFKTQSENSIIKNFKNFNAYKYYVIQRCYNLKTKKEKPNIVEYVLQLIDKKISDFAEEEKMLADLDVVIEKITKIKNEPILKKRRSLTQKNLKELSLRSNLSDDSRRIVELAKQLVRKRDNITDQLKARKEKLIPIIGDYGSGKSAFCHYLLFELCKKDDKVNPIFVPLGALTKHIDPVDHLVDDIYDFIKSEYNFNFSRKEFDDKISNAQIIFILDGLDERSLKLDDKIAQNSLNEIIRLATKTPVVLTSRQTYLSGEMERQLIRYDELIKILDFSDEEVVDFLHRYVDDQNRLNEIKSIIEEKKIGELARKPLFLFVIQKHFDYLKTQARINESAILEVMTDAWIEHDVEKSDYDAGTKKRVKNDRRRISEILAFREYGKPRRPIAKEEILGEVKTEFQHDNAESSAKDSVDRYYSDAIRSTFLIREGNDTYRFIARPVVEYFIASRIIYDIKKNRINSLLGHANQIKSLETFDFIKGIIDRKWAIKPHVFYKVNESNPDFQFLKEYENLSEQLFEMVTKYRGKSDNVGNLVKILHMTGNLQRRPLLNNLTLSDANLTNMDLRESSFENAKLVGAHLSGSDLSGAVCSDTDLSYSYLIGSNLSRTNFANAIMRNAHLTGANLSGVILKKARFVNVDANFVIINEDPIVDGIILVDEKDLGDKDKIKTALSRLDKRLRCIIIEKNPRYKMRK